eukprot:4780207-Amphidinium_carterae.2
MVDCIKAFSLASSVLQCLAPHSACAAWVESLIRRPHMSPAEPAVVGAGVSSRYMNVRQEGRAALLDSLSKSFS